ncbi:inaD-like protein isoform X3 [Vespula pensylvanica]|nr:inaD-like protein isoform X3 [Vespula pensylvanica]
MVLNTEWAQVEVINLINDGSGLGFGIIGGRSTGVVVKTILPGGVADRDNRLQSGDHILQIGDVNLRGMGSEQVAAVLRQSGTHVRLVVARPVEPTSPDFQAIGSHAPIVPTKILGDPDELERYLVHSVPETYNIRHVQQGDASYDNGYMYSQESDARTSLIMDVVPRRNPIPIGAMPVIPTVPVQIPELPVLTMDAIDVNSLPEMERFTVELKKDIYGLGITIAGYVCEKEELSGIFVKSISEGSAADLSNKIQINDRIVEVDGHSLQGYSNHEAVEVLRSTGQIVVLCLERYLRGPKYEQLQQAIAASELRLPQPSSPSITSLPSFPISADGDTTTEIEPEGESHTTVDSAVLQEADREISVTDEFDEATNVEALLSDPSSELTPQIRAAIKSKWQKIVGPDTEIVVAQLKKFAEGSGLGISLEGTVDVENGQEVRPHHYIRSILPEGPVGQNGTLRSGDELLEVNGYRLLGINHMEVVSVLKELPIHVRMVCGRNVASQDPLCPIDTAQHQAAFQTRSILGGSLQNLLPTMDRLVKAKSDGSLASTTTTATVTDASLNKMKSRSLEPLTGLAMWSSEPQIIELVKGERGLGFSILDYQDPMNPNETVIVIRSLVPGGVAQVDGQLIPGDRLLFVNDIALENATLDQAVQALKGAPKGTVRIGVAKPLPIPDSIVQRVPAICTVRRSRSFPNESETTDRAAELEDFLSSRSGMTDISTGVQAIADKKEEDQNRKQQQQRRRYQRQRYEEDQEEEKGKEEEEEEEEDEEEDHWKDASPLTPICSPTKIKQLKKEKATILSKNDEEIDSSNRFSSAKDKILSEEEVITPTIETMSIGMDGKEIYEIPDVITCVEQAAPKVKLKEKDSDIRRGDDITKIEKEKGREEETVGKVIVDLSDTSTLRRKKSDEEKRKCLNRYDSLDSRTQRESTETLDKSEGSSERISKKRVRSEREDEVSGVKRRSKRRETERDRRSKDGETSRRRSREERKSLKEQECIERVTQYLRKHSSLTAFNEPEPEYSYSTFDEDSSLLRSLDDERKKRMELEAAAKKEKDETEEEKEVKSKDDLKDTKLVESKVYEEKKISEEGTIIESDRFREGFKRSKDNVRINDELDEIIVDPMDIRRRIESDVLVESETGSLRKRRSLKPSISDTEVVKATKRPSSLRKRKGTVSNEASKESLLEESKKEVRIRETVQEIFFEDNSDQLSTLIPEIQLVKARIITAEEVATARCFEATDLRKIQIYSPAEVVFIRQDEDTTTIDKGETSRKSSSQLQLPLLGKSVSENTLTSEDMDDNKVSERNIKPEILLDLSKVSEIVDDTIVTDKEKDNKDKKVLSRTGSEGSKRSFIGAKGKFFDECAVKVSALSLPSEPEPELTALPEDVLVIRKDDNELEGNIFKDFDDKESSLEERADREEKRKQQEQQQQQQQQQQQEQKQQQQQQSKKSLTEEDVIKEKKEELGGEVVDYEKILRQQVERPLLGEDEEVLKNREEEDNLITQATVVPVVPRNFFKSVPESWKREVNEESFEDIQRNFKETQYSPREKREVETQTVQETKSTQCSPDQSLSSTAEIFETAGIHVALRFYQSPKREVQTQTQGESKSIQCSLDDLIYRELSFDPRLLVGKTLDNLVRSERIQIQESKSVQCIPEDISSEPKPKPIVDNKKEDSLFGSRKEVEVQTYQESKAVQCTDEELLPYEPDRTLDRSSNRSASLTATRNTESSASSPRKLATVVFVEGKTIMTVTQRDHDGNVAWSNHWGPERLVEIYREPKTSLGLSIVGGKVDLHNGSSSKSQNISGIFIKNVLPNSPAGRTGELKIGDRIIEVDGVDLRNSTHERAVEVIQAAGNPVCLLVQSLVHLSTENESNSQDGRSKNRLPVSGVAPGTPTASFRQKPSPISPVRSITPEVIQGGVEDSDKTPSRDFKRQSIRSTDGAGPSARRSSMKKSVRKKAPSPPSNPGILREVSEEREDHGPPVQKPPAKKYSSEESSEEEDIRELEGNVYTKGGMEISRKSAGNVKRSKAEIDADPEEEDEFGYTNMKIQKKYHNLGHKVLMVKVEKERGSLGISLAGHKDRNRMAVFICGINPNGSAHKVGGLAVGDEILEVNGMVLKGRCHLNASALIKCMAGSFFKIIVLRKTQGSDDIAVKPLVQFPPILDESEQFNAYKGVRVVPVKKGQYGLGIMIIEGKHAEVGQGIFVSDIQEGSAAEQAGLQVGDLILAVNMDCLLGSTYDEATSLLKKAEGVVKLTVCNPNQSKISQDGKEIKPPEAEVKPVEKKEPEKPKEPEPPQDPKDCKIQVGKDTTIEFQKEKDKGIGFTITGGSDTPMSGVFILEVFPDGAAGKDGRLQAGDQILDICQESFKAIEHEKAHEAVLKVTGTIIMVVHRSDKSPEEVEVELQKKSGKGAGLCLTGFKSGKGAYVSDLLPGGSALESGKICKGDRVVAICGQDVREAPVEDIAVHIKVSNPVQLKLARYKSAKQ